VPYVSSFARRRSCSKKSRCFFLPLISRIALEGEAMSRSKRAYPTELAPEAEYPPDFAPPIPAEDRERASRAATTCEEVRTAIRRARGDERR
jgi:hypothetical protein